MPKKPKKPCFKKIRTEQVMIRDEQQLEKNSSEMDVIAIKRRCIASRPNDESNENRTIEINREPSHLTDRNEQYNRNTVDNNNDGIHTIKNEQKHCVEFKIALKRCTAFNDERPSSLDSSCDNNFNHNDDADNASPYFDRPKPVAKRTNQSVRSIDTNLDSLPDSRKCANDYKILDNCDYNVKCSTNNVRSSLNDVISNVETSPYSCKVALNRNACDEMSQLYGVASYERMSKTVVGPAENNNDGSIDSGGVMGYANNCENGANNGEKFSSVTDLDNKSEIKLEHYDIVENVVEHDSLTILDLNRVRISEEEQGINDYCINEIRAPAGNDNPYIKSSPINSDKTNNDRNDNSDDEHIKRSPGNYLIPDQNRLRNFTIKLDCHAYEEIYQRYRDNEIASNSPSLNSATDCAFSLDNSSTAETNLPIRLIDEVTDYLPSNATADDNIVYNLRRRKPNNSAKLAAMASSEDTFSNCTGSDYVISDSSDTDYEDEDFNKFFSANLFPTNAVGQISSLLCIYVTRGRTLQNYNRYNSNLKISDSYLMPLVALDEAFPIARYADKVFTSTIFRKPARKSNYRLITSDDIDSRAPSLTMDQIKHCDLLLPEIKINFINMHYSTINDILSVLLTPYDFSDINYEFRFRVDNPKYRLPLNRPILIIGSKYLLAAFDTDTTLEILNERKLKSLSVIIAYDCNYSNDGDDDKRILPIIYDNYCRPRLANVGNISFFRYAMNNEIETICQIFRLQIKYGADVLNVTNNGDLPPPDLNRLVNGKKLIICQSYRDGNLYVSSSTSKSYSLIRGNADYEVVPIQRLRLYEESTVITKQGGSQCTYVCCRCTERSSNKADMYNHWLTSHKSILRALSKKEYCNTIDISQRLLKNKFASIIHGHKSLQQLMCNSLVFIDLTKTPLPFLGNVQRTKPPIRQKTKSNNNMKRKNVSSMKGLVSDQQCRDDGISHSIYNQCDDISGSVLSDVVDPNGLQSGSVVYPPDDVTTKTVMTQFDNRDSFGNCPNGNYIKICVDREIRYQCTTCMAVLKNKASVISHLRRMHLELTYQCHRCPRKTATLGILRNHIKSVHTRQFTCSQCNKTFGTISGVKVHEMLVHGSASKCMCDICGKNFNNNHYLENHKQNIHFFGPQRCNICDRLLTSKLAYRKHSLHCGKERPKKLKKYICAICDKGYTIKNSLKHHMYLHLNIRPFTCKICNARFTSPNYLGMHKAVHKDKLFPCPICNKAFNRRDNMNKHAKTQHPSATVDAAAEELFDNVDDPCEMV